MVTITARLTANDKVYKASEEIDLYEKSSDVTDQLVADANVGLRLRTQANVRNKIKAKLGIGGTTAESADEAETVEI